MTERKKNVKVYYATIKLSSTDNSDGMTWS